MNRLASNGEMGNPAGFPFSLGTMVPSGVCTGAFATSEMYSRTHRSLVSVSDRFQQQGNAEQSRKRPGYTSAEIPV